MMEWTQEQGTASAALALAKVRAWTRWLTAVERRRMPRFTRREARRRAGASADGSRRRAGGARHPRAPIVTPYSGANRRSRASPWRGQRRPRTSPRRCAWIKATTTMRYGTPWRSVASPPTSGRAERRRRPSSRRRDCGHGGGWGSGPAVG